MVEYFPEVSKVEYEGPDSTNPLSFKHYNAQEKILGKTMAEHLRFAVCYWHSWRNGGADPFGAPTRIMPWLDAADEMQAAEQAMHAHFEFLSKLGVQYWCWHDRDIAPEADNLRETNRRLDHIAKLAGKMQDDFGVSLLWGTANLFTHPRYMAGAATSPSPDVFAFAAAQVKKAMELTHELGGAGYTFWGGREGYETLLNTDMNRELEHLGVFLHLAADYKKEIGFPGQLYIEPKPKEPTKHQYDADAAACHAFLQKHKLIGDFKLNIEANHATLAGHSFQHELQYAADNGILGSVDANRGDLLLGWDTDQFATDVYDTTLAMYVILQAGGFTTGGLNFDAKLRRQSIDPVDLFHAHIGAMDTFARGLKNAAKLLADEALSKPLAQRYGGWDTGIGQRIEQGKMTLKELEEHALDNDQPKVPSGRQEMLENILNQHV